MKLGVLRGGDERRAEKGWKKLDYLRAVINLVKKGFFVVNHPLEFIGELLLRRGRGGILESLNDVGRVFLGRHDRILIVTTNI